MPSKSDRERRKAMAREAAAKKLEQEVSAMPISKSDLKDLFVLLDQPDSPPCDHTLRQTTAFLEERGLDKEKIIPWLNRYGGYCDCEVIYNVDDKWGEYIGRTYDHIDEDTLRELEKNIDAPPRKPWWRFW